MGEATGEKGIVVVGAGEGATEPARLPAPHSTGESVP